MLQNMAREVVIDAKNPEHPWDIKALDWPLTKDSVVVEVGGFKGRWALQMALRYSPKLHVFEPQRWAARVCEIVLGDMATVYPVALGITTANGYMIKWQTDGCSFIGVPPGASIVADPGPDGACVGIGEMVEISDKFNELGLVTIDVMLMNIEGYEYTLIPYMLSKGIKPKVLMVQFHMFADPLGTALVDVYDKLEQAGYVTEWDYGVVLQAFRRE